MNYSVTSPKGFCASGVHCGLKKNDAPDIALIISDVPANVAGVYTRNTVKGHSLVRSMEIVRSGRKIRGVIINSGNANACVGAAGLEDAGKIARETSGLLSCDEDDILTCSTGVIGQRLDMSKILSGLPSLVSSLSHKIEGGHDAMRAMMTTDRILKESCARINVAGKTITVSGMAKGSGMIHPDMATMISVITTDALIEKSLLQKLLSDSVRHTFNRVSVDGDTSVCDTLLILSNGMSGTSEIIEGTSEYDLFANALLEVCTDLSRMIAGDGEGATKLIEVEVDGAATERDAYLIVLSVCRSPLFKTAIFGEDANWGRIITAAGYSGAAFDPDKVSISIGGLQVCRDGAALPFDESEAKKILKNSEIHILISLSEGSFGDRMWTCDFSYDYVRINGSYRS